MRRAGSGVGAGAGACLGVGFGLALAWLGARGVYVRAGLGFIQTPRPRSPTVVPALAGKKVVAVSTGSTVSYAVTADGKAYAWGFGENLQLGNGEDEVRAAEGFCVFFFYASAADVMRAGPIRADRGDGQAAGRQGRCHGACVLPPVGGSLAMTAAHPRYVRDGAQIDAGGQHSVMVAAPKKA